MRVRFEGVSKSFSGQPVLQDLNLEIEPGEFLVLLGPSGCGKTTLLRLLAGLERADSGRILIGDRLVNDVAPAERDVAMVFQSYALYPHLSVFENIAFPLRARRVAPASIEGPVRRAAERLGLGALLQRRPAQLSGGQRQRVALGRAIVRDPAVFLMDEPLSNLDAKLRVQTRAEISKLHQRLKTTFIYVTHDQTEAMTMGTRIAVLNGGLLQQLDTPQTLYDKPANKFVAGFIGSPAMNFFENARLDRANGGLVVHVPDLFTLPVPPHKARDLDDTIGKQVVFGIRPEDIHDAQYVPPGVSRDACIRANVSVTERMGSEVYVYIEEQGKEFIGRFDPRSGAHTGESLDVVFDMDQIHLFDAETDRALI
jgi:multiple sugar transport system ATP-binding protein